MKFKHLASRTQLIFLQPLKIVLTL